MTTEWWLLVLMWALGYGGIIAGSVVGAKNEARIPHNALLFLIWPPVVLLGLLLGPFVAFGRRR